MAVLVTRPQPDADTTADALRLRGYEALVAPMLQYEPRPWQPDDTRYAGVIATSANALRGAAALQPLLGLPLYAVGEKTAEAARGAGFTEIKSADGDAAALRDLVAKRGRSGEPLLYLAGADLARDLAGELGAEGFTVVTQTTYRMAPVRDLPAPVVTSIADGTVTAVLHYSRRSARAFIEAVRTRGVEITALALPQCCLSDAVADVLRDGGASRLLVASHPDQKSLFQALDRAIGARSE